MQVSETDDQADMDMVSTVILLVYGAYQFFAF
jgi:hypothetical protein